MEVNCRRISVLMILTTLMGFKRQKTKRWCCRSRIDEREEFVDISILLGIIHDGNRWSMEKLLPLTDDEAGMRMKVKVVGLMNWTWWGFREEIDGFWFWCSWTKFFLWTNIDCFVNSRKFIGFQRQQIAQGKRDITSCRLWHSTWCCYCAHTQCFMVWVPVLKVYVRLPRHLLLLIVFHVVAFFVEFCEIRMNFPSISTLIYGLQAARLTTLWIAQLEFPGWNEL
jgi:hypothetical protein